MQYLIYGLIDPRNQQLKYIGQSSCGLYRPQQHCYPSRLKGITKNIYWIKKLLKLNLKPIIEILEIVNDKYQLDDSEQFWISYYKYIGCNLNNHTNGGQDGFKVSNRRNLTEEHKQKLSIAHSGKKLTEKHKQNIQKYWKDRPRGPRSIETKIKLSQVNGGKPFKDQFNNIYITQAEAARRLNISQAKISLVLNQKRSHTGGYKFEYLGE